MSDDHSRKRPQDDRGIRDVQLPLAVPAESLAEKVRRLLGKELAAQSLGEERWSLSALGHKRTFAVQNAMSALAPKADMSGALPYVR
jgi:hypothetical protein